MTAPRVNRQDVTVENLRVLKARVLVLERTVKRLVKDLGFIKKTCQKFLDIYGYQ